MTDQPTDSDPIRQARLDSLGVLLTRITNGLALTQEEARLLVDHVGTEVRDGTAAQAEVARLRAGEEDGYDPAALPTPGQWMKRYNYATAEQRLDQVARLVAAADHGHACMMGLHEVHIRDGREAEAAVRRVRTLIAGRWGKVDPDLVRAALDGTERATAGRLIAGSDELRARAEADMRIVNTAEAVRQMDADPTQPHTGLVVQPYRDHGVEKWVFRCWGTDTCDGLVSLDHASREWAEHARDRHLADDHKES